MSTASWQRRPSRRNSASPRPASTCRRTRRSSTTRRSRERSLARSRQRALGPRAESVIFGCAGALLALAVWTLLSQVLAGGGGVINRLASPAAVGRELVAYAATDLGRDLLSSLRVFVIGWLGGAVLATIVGLALGRVRVLGNIFLPVVEAIRPVSSIAWVPLSVVWFGFGIAGKVFLVGLAVFLVVIVYAVDGSRRTRDDLE